MLENITQTQFEQILTLLIFYKKCNPNKDVFLTVASFKEASNFFQGTQDFHGLPELL